MAQVDVALALGQAQEVALAQDRRKQGGDLALAQFAALQHEMRQSRMLSQPCHCPSVRRDRAQLIERPEIEQQGARRGQRGGGRRRQPGQGGVAGAPQRQFERQRRQVGVEDFGRREGQQAALRLLGPQAKAHAGFEAAGAAAALVGRRLAHPHRLQPRHARAWREARHPHQPAIDHDAHALDGEAGLGDRGRQHDLAPPGGRGRDGAVLVGRREIAIERRHVDIAAEVAQALLDPADLADAGQKDQRAAAFVGECPPHDRRHGILDAAGGLAVEIARVDRIHATGTLDHRRAAQPLRHRPGIEGRRHGDHAQVLAQRRLRLAHQGEGKVGLQPALVQFVEDHAADAVERGIVLQHPQEQAVGHDLDARARPHLGVQPHAVTDRLADRLAQGGRHAPRRGAGRQPPRLLHHDLAAGQPRRIEQRQRHARRLAGARRGDQHGGVAAGQRLLEPRQGLVDGKDVHRGRL